MDTKIETVTELMAKRAFGDDFVKIIATMRNAALVLTYDQDDVKHEEHVEELCVIDGRLLQRQIDIVANQAEIETITQKWRRSTSRYFRVWDHSCFKWGVVYCACDGVRELAPVDFISYGHGNYVPFINDGAPAFVFAYSSVVPDNLKYKKRRIDLCDVYTFQDGNTVCIARGIDVVSMAECCGKLDY